jgi:hypothetical protein
MTKRAAIEDFVAQKKLAVVGVSHTGKKFGNLAFRELKAKGYRVFPINPNAEKIEDERCYPTVASLPEPVGGVLIVVPPVETERVVREAAAAGIERIWMQQGSESGTAIRYCQENGMAVIHGECILMYAQPVLSVHRLHRWVWRLFGKLA